MAERIQVEAPFDFRKMLQRPLSRTTRLSVIDESAASYACSIRLRTRAIAVKTTWFGDVEHPFLDIHLPEGLSEGEKREAINIVRFMLSADKNISGFVEQFSGEPVWRPVIQDFYGLRPILDASLFESMVKIIIGQQLNVQFAATLVERLVQITGEVVECDGNRLYAFPSPEQVATWSSAQLRERSFSQRKAEYIIDFARAIVNGEVDLDRVWHMSDEEVIEMLTRLRGIGRWTVECLLLFGMGREDVMPAADIGVQNAVQALYRMQERPKETQLREMAAEWRPWRSYATYYLWNSLIKR